MHVSLVIFRLYLLLEAEYRSSTHIRLERATTHNLQRTNSELQQAAIDASPSQQKRIRIMMIFDDGDGAAFLDAVMEDSR